MSDRYAQAGGRPLVIDWRLERHLFFSWEIDTDAAEAMLPEELETVEVRPGISLLSLGALRYEPGHFGPESPAFHETVAAIHTAPDLSLPGPTPRFCFYAVSVYSDSAGFVEQDTRLLSTPSDHVPTMRQDFDDDGLGVRIWDERGPIAVMRNTHPNPRYEATEFYGQHMNDASGQLVRGIWQWEGTRFEHMERGDVGGLHPHPFWKGLDLDAVGSPYRQMMAEPGARHRERFYEVWR